MRLLQPLRSWLAYRSLFGGPAPFDHHDPAQQRDHQRLAARQASRSNPHEEKTLGQPH